MSEALSMTRTIEEAREVIKGLSREDKEILSGELVQSVNQSNPELYKLWVNEAENRAQDITNGNAEIIDGESVKQRLRSKVYDKA